MVGSSPGLSVSANPAYPPGSQPAFDGGGFTPNLLGVTSLWLDGGDPSSLLFDVSNLISEWNDKSGNGNDGAQGVGANQPTFSADSLNGKSTVLYALSDAILVSDDITIRMGAGDFTISMVIKATQAGVVRVLQKGRAGGSGNLFRRYELKTSSTVITGEIDSDTEVFKDVTGTTDSNFHIYRFVRDNTAPSNNLLELYKDGVLLQSEDIGAYSSLDEVDPTSLGIGSNAIGGGTLIGNIAEVIMYKSLLTSTNTTILEDYLSNKWGISVTPPTNILDLELWLDGADTDTIQSSGGLVSQWDDKSGNGNDATQGTGSAQPTTNATKQVGLNVLDFDGSDVLTLPSALFTVPNGDSSIFLVSKRTSEDATVDVPWALADSGEPNNGHIIIYDVSSGQISYRNNVSGTQITATGNTNTDFNIINGVRSGTAQELYINGTLGASDALGVNVPSIDVAQVGEDGIASLFLTGNIAEIIFYSRALSTSERAAVNTYLSNKWAITIP